MKIISLAGFLLIATILLNSCSSLKRKNANTPEVPIAITIQGNSPDLNKVDLNYFMLKFLDDLKQFQRVDLKAVEPEDNPQIVLNLNIQDFTIWPKDQVISRRVFTRNVVVGQDEKGRAVTQTVQASADIVQEVVRANARFSAQVQIKGSPGATLDKFFAPNYRRNYVYVDNVQGDARALDPSLYTAQSRPFYPEPYELLLTLSRQEMLERLSNFIRSYYGKK